MDEKQGESLGRKLRASVAAGLLFVLTQFGARLCRLRAFRGEENLIRLREQGQPFIFCLWHNRLAYLPWFMSGRLRRAGIGLHALISRSRDGDVMTRVARWLGYHAVRGSTSRGGVSGLREMTRALGRGDCIATVGDGPRGPRYVLKPGPVALAKLSGAPIVPIAFSADRVWILDSWDGFIVPKPLSRTAVVLGEPLFVERTASEEDFAAALAELEKRMHAAVREAEGLATGIADPGDR